MVEGIYFLILYSLIKIIAILWSAILKNTSKLKALKMEILEQIKLYLLSLMFLFIIVFLMSINTLTCDPNIKCSEPDIIDYLVANWLPCMMLVAVFACERIRRSFEFGLQGGTSDSLNIAECKSESYEHLTFLSTYIIPFLGFNFESPQRLLAYLFLLILIGFMLIRSGQVYANPTLAIFGYQLYRANLTDGENNYNSIVVLTKSKLNKGDNVAFKFISKTTCFVRKVNNAT